MIIQTGYNLRHAIGKEMWKQTKLIYQLHQSMCGRHQQHHMVCQKFLNFQCPAIFSNYVQHSDKPIVTYFHSGNKLPERMAIPKA